MSDEITLRAAQLYWQSRGWYTGLIDGIWGPKSAIAHGQHMVEVAREKGAKLQTAGGYVPDERSARNIATLLPPVQKLATEFLAQANATVPDGYDVKIISGTRTYAEQDALYAQGRTKPGPIVTNATGGYSNHNFGIAFDIGIFKGKDYLGESPLYAKLGKLGKSLGLVWGGEWKSIQDEPHFEYPTGLTLAEMRRRVANNQPIIG